MRKHITATLSALIVAMGLTGCATPPTPFPEKSQEQNTVNLTGHLDMFSYNGFETKTDWLYHMSNTGSTVNNEHFALFWYLAQHSDRVTIYGPQELAKGMERNLLEGGTVQRVSVVNICYMTRQYNCGGKLEVFFQRGTHHLPVVVSKTMFNNPIYYR